MDNGVGKWFTQDQKTSHRNRSSENSRPSGDRILVETGQKNQV
jgi:hypothetical protein